MNLHEVEELTQALFEEAGDALLLFDPVAEQILEANPMAQKLSGQTRAQLLQLQVSQLFRSETPGGIHRLRNAYRKTGLFHSQEGFLLRNREGYWIPVNLTITRLHVRPRTLGLITARDVREQREAHRQLQRMEGELRRVLASITDCLYSAEINGAGRWVYRYLSPVIEQIAGQPPTYFMEGVNRWWSTIHPDDRPAWEKAQAKLIGGQSAQTEYRIVWPDGEQRWVRDSVNVSRLPDEPLLKLDGILTDITAAKQAERLINAQNEVLDLMARGTPLPRVLDRLARSMEAQAGGFAACIHMVDGGQRLRYAAAPSLAEAFLRATNNLAIGEQAGTCAAAAALGQPVVSTDLSADPCWEHHRELALRHGLQACWAVPILATGGEVLGVIGIYYPRPGFPRPADQALVERWGHVAAIAIERKRNDERLRRSEELYRALVENSYDVISLVNADRQVIYTSPSIQRVLGYTPEEMTRVGFDNLHPDDRTAMQELFADCLGHPGKQVRAEFRARHKDSSYRHLEGFAVNRLDDPSIRAVITSYRDITERKLAEEQLRQSNQALRALIQASPLAILALDTEGTVRSWNPAAERIFGWKEAEVVNRPVPIVPPQQHGENLALRQKVVSGHSFAGVPGQRQRKDGTLIDVSISAAPLYDAQGRVNGIMAVLADVTDRRRAQETLARERAILRGLIDSIPDLIFYKDRRGAYIGCNKAFEKYSGRSEKELIGLTDLDLFSREVGLAYQDRDRQVLAEGRPRRMEEWLQYPDGQLVLVEVLKTPFYSATGEPLGLIGISRDITERKRLEEQLRQSQKMEAIGQLAGGVAHDFNNLLTAILGNVSLLLGNAESPQRDMLLSTETAALRAADLTRQLLGFSRQTMLRLELTNLNTAIQEIVGILRPTIDPRITVQVQAAADLWTARADPGQMNQVLMNLCLNARDAMPTGGLLLLETANVKVNEAYARMHLEARPGEFVRLRVSDTGSGIAAEIRPRIFEPFFTTKKPGQGTGLGLAMVFGIVKQHHGWIECHSEIGKGTRFDIYLPRYGAAETDRGSDDSAPAPAGGHETVLLVDDEPMIRNLGRTILTRYGYQVLLAEDGQEAVEIYLREKDHIDLVILDLTMPRLSGHDTLRQLRRINPEVAVLFASGYSAEHVTESDKDGVLGFINKPYRPQDLAATIRAALNRRSVRNGQG